MQSISMAKRIFLKMTSLVGMGGVAMLSGCALAQTGERFGIGIASRLSKPPLEAALLISDTKLVRVDGTGAHINYGASNGVQVPNEIEFIWRAIGEKETHLEKINLRSQIPSEVLNKIGGLRPMHTLSVEFFVLDGSPKYRWRLRQHSQDMNVPSRDVEKGGN